jgi:UDP-N-acetylglucosamine--dolichyl-phosphate N-acetylglucosaminephosphotransferase
MIWYYLGFGLLAFLVSFILTKNLIPRLKRFEITGKDENKANAPEIPEMGGIAIVAGFTAGLLLAIFTNSFINFQFNLVYVLAALITIHSIGFIGMVDDLLNLPQWLKAILPLFAAIPLIATQAAGSTAIGLPFIGQVDFGIIYILVLVPLGVAVASNLTNMLAGFNGMEAGMGIVMFGAMAIIGITNSLTEVTILSVSMLSALLAFLAFNIYPAKIFPGDVGNLTIGVVLASTVIIGNIESAGAILVIPYVIDFFIKAKNRFPHTYQEIRGGGKLYPKEGKVKGFVHLIMKLADGITEKNLSLVFIGMELVFALVAILMYAKF